MKANNLNPVYEIGDRERFEKWIWKMTYCKEHGLAPAQNYVWDHVESKWEEYQLEKKNESEKVHNPEIPS
jgi:hypothetical protein